MDDPVVIVDDQGTEHEFPAGFDPKTAAAIVRAKSAPAGMMQGADTGEGPAPSQPRTLRNTVADVGTGMIKGLGSSIASLGESAVNAGMVPGVTPAAFNSDLRHPIFQKTDAATTASNTPQRVGKVIEGVLEMAVPGGQGVNAVPRASRAGRAFQDVMSAAKNVPLNTELPGNAALRVQQLAERGGTMPRSVMKLLGRMTDPNQAPLAFEEARDFASNISRLSADEFGRLTPAIQREVGNLKTALNEALAEAAGTVGKRAQYEAAMREYAGAKKLSGTAGAVWEGAKKALPYATGAGAGTYFASQLMHMLRGD
jgi:hypothetical protein